MSERRSALEGRLRRSRGKGLLVSRTTGKPAARLSVAAAAGSPVDPLVRTFACGASGEGCSDASDPLMSDRPFAGGDPAVDSPDASDQEMTEGEEGSEESEQEERADGDVLHKHEDDEVVLGKGEEAERDVQEDEVGDKQKAADLPGGVSSSEYSWGIHDGTLLWMVISVVLLNVFLRMLPLPGLQTNDPASKVWRISLLLCAHLFAMIIPIRITASVLSVLIGISYGPLLAIAAFHIISPHAGMTIVHLSTAWAAGMFGYNLAQYCLHEGTENAASVAVARTPTRLSKKQRRQRLDTEVYCVVTTSFLTLCFAGRVLWLLFIPSYQDNICMLVVELSVLVWTVLYFWLIILSPLMLHGALISAYSMLRIFAYFMISCIVSVVCYLVSHVLWAYFFALEMMFMAAVIGYSLTVFQHYKGLLKQKRRQCFTVRPRRKMTVVTRRLVLDSVPLEEVDITRKEKKEVDIALNEKEETGITKKADTSVEDVMADVAKDADPSTGCTDIVAAEKC